MKIQPTFFLLLATLILIVGHAQQPKPKPAEQQTSTIRIDTTLVNVPVSVLDRSGKFIANLRREDFRLFEDGVEQEITHFKNIEEPVTVALLLDISDSARIKFDEIKMAAIAFVDQLRPQDRALVVVFDSRVTVMAEPSDDKERVRNAIIRTVSGGGTSVYDAVRLTFREQLSRVQGRKAVVLFTDGVDLHSKQATAESTLALAEENDAPVYAIRYDTYEEDSRIRIPGPSGMSGVMTTRDTPGKKEYELAQKYLFSLSEVSGGRYFFADKLENLKQSFAKIAEELKQQYVIGYYPSNVNSAKKRRGVKVKVGLPNVAVRARKSYVYRVEEGGKEKR
jgi:Ca-activated chloride channel family protein